MLFSAVIVDASFEFQGSESKSQHKDMKDPHGKMPPALFVLFSR